MQIILMLEHDGYDSSFKLQCATTTQFIDCRLRLGLQFYTAVCGYDSCFRLQTTATTPV